VIEPENPPGFIVKTEVAKAAFHNGFRVPKETAGAWLRFGSTTARGDIWLSGVPDHGPWYLSPQRASIAAEFALGSPSAIVGPGAATFMFVDLAGLYSGVERAYRLGVSLPDEPLEQFRKVAEKLPRTTEAERLVVMRVGQAVFRDALMQYWHGTCPMTGITDPLLLRASHIVAWADCDNDAQRLDVHNGLLLSSLWDAAFDGGLISLADDGRVLVSPSLSARASAVLKIGRRAPLDGLTPLHRANLAMHRAKHGFEKT
jgi:hypothetical protein